MANEYTKEEIERMRMVMEEQGENAFDKMKRKMKQEPLVPAGMSKHTSFLCVCVSNPMK